jgi:hypothetical protein
MFMNRQIVSLFFSGCLTANVGVNDWSKRNGLQFDGVFDVWLFFIHWKQLFRRIHALYWIGTVIRLIERLLERWKRGLCSLKNDLLNFINENTITLDTLRVLNFAGLCFQSAAPKKKIVWVDIWYLDEFFEKFICGR